MQVKKRLKVLKGDTVTILAGDDKGKRGKVISVSPERNTVVVEGLNMHWKHLRKSQQNPQGARIQREGPIHVSNVMVVSPDGGKPQRVRTVVFEGKSANGETMTYRYRVGAKDKKPMSERDQKLAEKHTAGK